MTVFYVLAGIFGALVGSFLNVVIYRMPKGERFGWDRSRCPHCGTQIAGWDNLPILSFLVLRGKSRCCRKPISLQYPAVEAVTAGLFVLSLHAARRGGLEPLWLGFLVLAAFVAILVAASAIDFRHKLLPDKLTIRAGPVVGIIASVALPTLHGTKVFGADLAGEGAMKPALASLLVGVVGALAGAGLIYLIRAIGSWFAKREAMGLGDVKFMGMCGLMLGPGPVLLAIGVGIVVGAFLGIGIWIITKNREIPFGPFLALGALAVLFYGPEVHEFVTVTYPSWISGGSP